MNDNGGCAMAALVLFAAVVIGTIAIGGPVLSEAGLSWDSSAVIARQNARLEAERLRLAAETARVREREETARVMSDNMMVTIQWLAGAGVIVGGLAVAGWATQRSVAAWAARPHRPVAPPPQIIVMAHPHLMAQGPDARLEWVEEDDFQGWAIVNDRLLTVRPLQLTDSRHRG